MQMHATMHANNEMKCISSYQIDNYVTFVCWRFACSSLIADLALVATYIRITCIFAKLQLATCIRISKQRLKHTIIGE